LEAIGWKYYLVFVVVLVLFGLTAYFFYPETRGHTLEQMAVIFDGNDAEVPPPAVTAERTGSVVEERRASMASEAKPKPRVTEVSQHQEQV
jgi:Sugar (and other) transporter